MQNAPSLTPRLQEIADAVAPCRCVADIGTDHAYLPAHLCAKGVCASAIASDIRAMPLESAKETIVRYHLGDRIKNRLGGGASTLLPGEADAIVIAGMGGLMIAQILKDDAAVFQKAAQILVQPMSSVYELRTLLWEYHYRIAREWLSREGEKLYHIMAIAPGREEEKPSEWELFMGRSLLKERPQYFADYWAQQKKRLEEKHRGLLRAKTIDEKELQRTEAMCRMLHKTEEDMGW